MIERLYEKLTGRPYRTVRSAAAEFGPPPAADPLYAEALRHYTDAELCQRGDVIMRHLREQHAAMEALLARAEQTEEVSA